MHGFEAAKPCTSLVSVGPDVLRYAGLRSELGRASERVPAHFHAITVAKYNQNGIDMANIKCPACGGSHRYMATALANLLEAALAGDLHRVTAEWCSQDGERITQIQARCPLELVPEHPANGARKAVAY